MDTNQSQYNKDNSVADFGTGEVTGPEPLVPAPQQVAPATTVQQAVPVAVQQVAVPSVAPQQAAPTTVPQAPVIPAVMPQVTPQAQVAPQVQAAALGARPATTPLSNSRPIKRKLTPEEIIQRDRVRNKKMVLGCGGAFGVGAIILIILIFVFVGQGSSGTNALAQSLGINQQSLISTLSLIVNLFFGIGAFITFVIGIGGIFKAVMARKDDVYAKKRGYVMAGGSFGALVVIIMMWIGAWLFLSGQQLPTTAKPTGLVTQPESTINLVAPIEITFDASNLPYESTKYDIVSYLWDFGDGQAGPGSSIETHRYEKKGTGRYDVKLTLTFVQKNTGEETTETLTRLITIADEKVAAVINASVTSGDAPLEVNFDGSASSDPDGVIKTYAWEIDGKGFTEGTAAFTSMFDKVGVYTVKLRVTNQRGDFDIVEQQITVSAGKMPVAAIEILNNDGGVLYVNKNYTFDASASVSPGSTITGYEWDFGDGTTKVKSRTAQHIFTKEGTYKIILTITDKDGLTGTKEMEVNVELAPAAPNAVMKTDPAKVSDSDTSISGSVPFEVNFNATSSSDPDDDIVDYKWDFDGDGVFDSAGETTSYVYNAVGSYNASLTVIDSAGFEDKEVVLVKAVSKGLEARLSADPVSGVVPLTVNFDAIGSTYTDGDIVSYEWDFGDGSAPRSDVGQVTYKYTKIGNFTTTVKVRTNDGKQEEATILISVRQVPLKSCFELSKTVGDAPLAVIFNPQCSTGTTDKYKWSFGDGENSAERKPTHIFTNPGSYEVTLEISDVQNVVDVSSQFVTVTGELTQ
jgi:PKD repeat protein